MLEIKRTGQSNYGQYVKALIVGPPGSGKTLTSSTWKNPLIASAEGGLMSIADRSTPYVDIRSSTDLLQLKILLEQEPEDREKHLGFPVDSFVVDTIDEIQKIFIRERLEEGRKDALELRDWGWLGDQMRAVIRGLRNLDMNVLLTCHVKETTDSDTGHVYFVPALQGAIGNELPGDVDLALLLRAQPMTVIEDNQTKRVMQRFLQTYPDRQHPWIKDRSGKLAEEVEINFEDDFDRIFDAIYGTAPQLEDHEPVMVQTAEKDTVAKAAPAPKVVGKKLRTLTTEKVKVEDVDLELKAESIPEVESPNPDRIACEVCAGTVESENQADLSKIRFRKVLCRKCFVAAKTGSSA